MIFVFDKLITLIDPETYPVAQKLLIGWHEIQDAESFAIIIFEIWLKFSYLQFQIRIVASKEVEINESNANE